MLTVIEDPELLRQVVRARQTDFVIEAEQDALGRVAWPRRRPRLAPLMEGLQNGLRRAPGFLETYYRAPRDG
jgi:hypothetical protein